MFFFTFQFDPSPIAPGIVSPKPLHLLPVLSCAFKIVIFTYGETLKSCSDCLNKEGEDHPQWIPISRQKAEFIQSEPVTELGREAETPKSQPNAVQL